MTPPREKSELRFRWVAAGACALAGVVLFQFFGNATRGYVDTPSVFWWWVSQWLDPLAETEHGWLILGIAAWLWWRNARAVESSELRAESRTTGEIRMANDEAGARGATHAQVETRRPRRVFGGGGAAAPCVAMGAALLLHAVGFVAQQTRLSIVAVLLFTWGVVRLGGGRRWGDAAMFPLGFMVFAIPLNVLDSVGFWLRLWVIDAAGVIAHLSGIEVVRSGTQLFSPDGRYQYDVAAACSGVRSLMALAALSLLVGYLNFRSGWRRALMLALCLPLTYFGNVARIAVIIFAAQVGGQIWGERAHDVMGFGVFAIVLGGVLAAARGIRRFAPESEERWTVDGERRTVDGGRRTVAGAGRARNPGRLGTAAAISVALAVVAVCGAEMFFLARVASAPARGAAGVRLTADGRDPVELPAFVGTDWIGRRIEVTAVERDILPADTGFSRRNYVHVQGGVHAVFLSIVLSGRDRTSIHRPELCLVGQGWTIRGADEHRFAWRERGGSASGRGSNGSRSIPATLLRTERTEASGERIPALVAYWFVNGDRVVATHWERAVWDAWNRVRHGRVDRWAYVLLQADAADGSEAALARMQAVLDETLPAFQTVR